MIFMISLLCLAVTEKVQRSRRVGWLELVFPNSGYPFLETLEPTHMELQRNRLPLQSHAGYD